MGKHKKRRGPRKNHKGKKATKDKMNDEEQGVNSETRRNDSGVLAWLRWLFLFEWLRRGDSRVAPTDAVLSSTKQLDAMELQTIPDKSVTSSAVHTTNECDNEKVHANFNEDLNDLQTNSNGLEADNQMHLRREQQLSSKIKDSQKTAIKYKEKLKQLSDKLIIANDQLKDQAERHLEEIGKCNHSMKNKDLDLDERNEKITNLENEVSMQKHTHSNLQQNIKSLQKRIKMLENEEKQRVNMINNKDILINSLTDEKLQLEEEKQDALRRLSAMMSVKLRDNNPNIADLSDQFRPTKLGEQFSELYDNEWTDAFDALQNEFEDRHAIRILLDIVMESYQFCDQELLEVWIIAENWFIDKDATTAQQISKTLKDGRKQRVLGRVEDIQQKYTGYLLKVCNTKHLDRLMTSNPLRNYISTCVRLALLMTANDPPVVIECPGWQRLSERQYPRETVPHSSSVNGPAPEYCNRDERKKSKSDTMDETLENDIKGKIHLTDNSKKYCQESINLTKMISRLETQPDENFEPTDGAQNTLSYTIDDTDRLHDIPTDAVRNDKAHQTNDGPVEDMFVAESGQHYHANGYICGPQEPQNSDTQLTETGFSPKDKRIEEPANTENNVGNTNKIVLSGNEYNVGTDSPQSQVVDSPTDTDTNRDSPTNITVNIDLQNSTQTTQSNPIDGICQQMVNLSIHVRDNEAHQENETGNAAQGDIVEDDTCDTKDGTEECMSDEESGQHHYSNGHTGDPHEPLNSDAQLTETSFNLERFHESEKTGNIVMTRIKIDATECNVGSDNAKTQGADSRVNTDPKRDTPTDANLIINVQGKSVESTYDAEFGRHQAVEEDTVDDQTNDANISNTKEGTLEGASNIKSGQQQCAERDIIADQKNGDHPSDIKNCPPEDTSDTVHVSGQHQATIGNTHDSQVPLLSDLQSNTTGNSFYVNRIEESQQNENDVNHNCTTAATKESHNRSTAERDKVERPIFDRDKFKEYTSRGPYVEYFVWPIMYLHRDGPMLAKGIAQGSKVKMDDGSNTLLVSWKKVP